MTLKQRVKLYTTKTAIKVYLKYFLKTKKILTYNNPGLIYESI